MDNDTDFDRALIAAAFDLAALDGWNRLTVPAAARHGGLDLREARGRFPSRNAILLRFGRMADMAALAGAAGATGMGARDRLFDIVMRRIDVLQTHRAGVLALFRALPFDPATALLLAEASRRSMSWLLEGAGIDALGLRGSLRAKGLLAVWLWTVRAWSRDETEDLTATLAALDRALDRAEQAERSIPGNRMPPGDRTPDIPSTAAATGHATVPDPLQPQPPQPEPPQPAPPPSAPVPPPAIPPETFPPEATTPI